MLVVDADAIIRLAAVLGALGVIWGIVYGIIKWFQKQEKQTTDIALLREIHKSDMKTLTDKETDDLQSVKDELCVLSYAVLATLDGLKQLGANGNVTKAHNELEKHLNQQAHNQK